MGLQSRLRYLALAGVFGLSLAVVMPAVRGETSGATTPASGRASTQPSTRPSELARLAKAVKGNLESVGDLKVLQGQVKKVVAQVEPAVVGLRIGAGQGSGVIVSEDGFIITAGHVASAPGKDVAIIMPDGKKLTGKSLGINYAIDSGMVKINEPGKYPFVEMGSSADLKKGDWCIVMGHPGGYKAGRTPPVRLGKILDNRPTVIRTDCTLVGGDSGGPVFDLSGRVIGINSRIGTSVSDNMHVPVDTFKETWERLEKGEAWGAVALTSRPGGPYLGVQVDQESPECKIGEIFPGSAAEKAGLKVGDVITKFDGQKVTNFGELMLNINRQKAGDEISLEVRRDDKPLKVKLTLGKRQ